MKTPWIIAVLSWGILLTLWLGIEMGRKAKPVASPEDTVAEWLKTEGHAIEFHNRPWPFGLSCAVSTDHPAYMSIRSERANYQACVADAMRKLREVAK